MKTKHTPGPWKVEDRGQLNALTVHASDGLRIALIEYSNDRKIDEADAGLIAAAPDLLAALKELVSRCDGEEGIVRDGSNIQTIKAHAAIKKAGDWL